MSIKSIYRSFDGTIPFHLTFVPTEATGKNLFGGGTKSVNGFPTSNDMTSSILQCLNQMKKTWMLTVEIYTQRKKLSTHWYIKT